MKDILLGGLALVLFYGGPLSILAPVPLATLALIGRRPAQASAFGGILLAAVLIQTHLADGRPFRVVYVVGLLALAVILASRRLPARLEGRAVLWILVSMGLLFGLMGTESHSWSAGFVAYARERVHEAMETILTLPGRAALPAEQLHFLRAHRDAIESTVLELLPGLTLASTLLLFWINAVVLRLWGRLDQVSSVACPSHFLARPLAEWRVPDVAAWFVIAAGALFFVNEYGLKHHLLKMALANVFIFLFVVYFLHGLAIVGFHLKRRLSPLTRGLVFMLIFVFFQTLGVVVASLGFFDLWLDFRRLEPKNQPP